MKWVESSFLSLLEKRFSSILFFLIPFKMNKLLNCVCFLCLIVDQ